MEIRFFVQQSAAVDKDVLVRVATLACPAVPLFKVQGHVPWLGSHLIEPAAPVMLSQGILGERRQVTSFKVSYLT